MSPPKKDPYQTLGVSPEATADEIKKAYRKLAQKYHPDRGGDEDRFKEVSVAYDVLGNADKRAQYDAMRNGSQMPPGFSGVEFGDLFSQIFGGGFGGGPSRGSRVEYRVNMGGSPFEGFSGLGGFGGGDPFANVRPRTRRKAESRPKASKERKVKAKDGAALTQRGSDIHSDLRIQLDQAILGAVVPVSTLGGTAKVKIPPGTSSGVKLRLKGKGAPKSNGTRGNHYVTVQIDVPKSVDSKSEKLLAQFMDRVKKSK